MMLATLISSFVCVCFFLRFYLFIFREGDGWENERERNVNVRNINCCISYMPQLGTQPAAQACALTGDCLNQ